MKKITINKLEESVEEKGIQIRNDDPASILNGRIYFNKNTQEFFYESSTKGKITVGVYSVDPISPSFEQVWINATSNTVKYFDGVSIKTITFSDKAPIAEMSSNTAYLSVLSQAELKTFVASMETGKIVEAFNTGSGVHENTQEFNSKLRLQQNKFSGSHINTGRTSAGETYAEGALVGSVLPLAVESYETVDLDTSKAIFKGNQTDVLAVGLKFSIFEKENSSEYFLLNGDQKVQFFTVGAVNYNAGTNRTEVTFDKPAGTDLDMSGNGTFILPIKFKVSANATGSTSTFDELELDQIFTVDGPDKILGEEDATKIKLNLAGERIIHFGANCSPSRKYWIIIALCRTNEINPTYNTSPFYQVFYSDDGLRTIHRYTKYWAFDNNWSVPKSDGGNGVFNGSWQHSGVATTNLLIEPRRIKISDDGKFYFALGFGRNDVGYHTHKPYFGHFNVPKEGFKINKFTQAFRSGRSDILSFTDTQHETGFSDSIDWENNILCAQVCYQSAQAVHFQFHKLDFLNGTQSCWGYTHYGSASADGKAVPAVMNEVVYLEGENHFFFAIPHVSGYYDCYKVPCKNIATYGYAGYTGAWGSLGSTTLDTNLKLPSYLGTGATRAFSNSIEGGNKGDWATPPESTVASTSYTSRLMQVKIKDQKIFMLWASRRYGSDGNQFTPYLRVIDLARTRKATSPKITLQYMSNTELFTLKVAKLSDDTAGDTQLYNLSRNGALASIASVGSWDYINNPNSAVNGNTSDYAIASGSDSASLNNGKGLQVQFNTPTALKRFKFYGYVGNSNILCNHAIEYYNGSSWVRVATVANSSVPADRTIDFNLDGAISATYWRWYMESWTANGTNFYLYELECYSQLPPYTAGLVTSTITKNFTATQIKTVIEALTNVGAGNATVTTIGGSAYSHSIDQLLANSEFDSSANWDVFRTGIGSGFATFNYADDQSVCQTVSGLKVGATYTISLNVFNYTNGLLYAVARAGAVASSAFIGISGAVASQNISGNGNYSFTFVATNTVMTFGVWASSYTITSSQVRVDYFRVQATNPSEFLVASAGAVICVIELTGKAEPYKITLNSGSDITLSTNEVGQVGKYLRIANSTQAPQKYLPETGALIPLSRQLNNMSIVWASGYGTDDRRSGHANNFRMVIKDKTVYYHTEAIGDDSGLSTNANEWLNYFIKVPDYTTSVGSVFSCTDIGGYTTRTPISKYGNVTKKKVATIWTARTNSPAGSTNTVDAGKIPVRTILFYFIKSYRNTTDWWAGLFRDQYFRVKVCGLTADGLFPDESNVIALSTKYPMSELPSYSNYRAVPFCFDNLKLNVGQQVAFVIEIVDYEGNDTFPWDDQNLNDRFLLSCRAYAPSPEFRGVNYESSDYTGNPSGFSWKIATTEAYTAPIFDIMDTYVMPVPFLHAGKDNMTVSRDVNFQSTTVCARNILDAGLGDAGVNESDRKLIGNYRLYNHQLNENTSGYDGEATNFQNAIAFSFNVDDPTVEGMPVIGPYKVVGEPETGSEYDEHTMFAYYPRLNDNTRDITEADPTTYFSDSKGARHARVPQVGGFFAYWDDNTNMGQLDRTDLDHGLKTNPLFQTGYAWKLNGSQKFWIYGQGLSLGSRDFILEQEWIIDPSDVDAFDDHRMLFGTSTRFYFSVYRGRLYFVFYNDAHGSSAQQSIDWWDAEEVPVSTYFRLRCTRTSKDGFRVFINFDKDREDTWVERFSGKMSNFASMASAMRWWSIGINQYFPSHWIGISGYAGESTSSYKAYGWVGYTRLNVGSATFKQAVPTFKGHLPFSKIENHGQFLLGMKAQMPVGDTDTNYPYSSGRTLCDLYIFKDNKEDAKISSQDHVFKFKGNIAKGQKPTVKVEISKVSETDVSEVQGYVVQFDRK